MITDTSQCSNSPINGVLRGLLLAQSRENGKIPSLAISCTTTNNKHDILRREFSEMTYFYPEKR